MEEKEKEKNSKNVDTTGELQILYIEDNNLNLFLDDTIELVDVIEKVKKDD